MTGIVRIFMLTSAVLGLMLIGVAVSAWRQRRRLSSMVELLAAALCLSVGALCATIAVGIRGYNALTQEVVAATIVTEPLAPQRFRATVTLPDSSVRMFDLAGDLRNSRLDQRTPGTRGAAKVSFSPWRTRNPNPITPTPGAKRGR